MSLMTWVILQDLNLAKGEGVIKRELEKELQLLRATHARTLEGTSGDRGVERADIGSGDSEFSFNNLPMKVS